MIENHDAEINYLRSECERQIFQLLTQRAGHPALTRKDKMNITRARQVYIEMLALYEKCYEGRTNRSRIIPPEQLETMSIYG